MFGLFRKRSAAEVSEAFGERDQNPQVVASFMGMAETGPWGKAFALEGEQAKPDYGRSVRTSASGPARTSWNSSRPKGSRS